MEKKLTRGRDQALGGVCSGLAEYFGLDTSLVRIITLLLIVFNVGNVFLVYLILWIILPNYPIFEPGSIKPEEPVEAENNEQSSTIFRKPEQAKPTAVTADSIDVNTDEGKMRVTVVNGKLEITWLETDEVESN